MKWYFSKDDCLHITENGKVPDYFEGAGGEPPWQLWKNRIRFLYIEEGITDLGGKCFPEHAASGASVLAQLLKADPHGMFFRMQKTQPGGDRR